MESPETAPGWDAGVVEPAWLTSPAGPPVDSAPADSHLPARPSWFVRRRGVLVVVSVAVAVLGGGAVVGGVDVPVRSGSGDLVRSGSDDLVRSGSGERSAAAAPTVPDTTWCAGLGSGDPATLDSADPGAAAIAGFEWGYYVARDGARARVHVAPDARVGSAERLDREGIGTLPVGTTHCVLTKRVDDGLYIVDVWERRPGVAAEHYPQTIRTRVDGTGALITAISVRE